MPDDDLAENVPEIGRDREIAAFVATIDGKTAEVFPVNMLSRGVIVPKGSHRIRMSYLPPGLVAGAATSAAMLLAMIAIVIVRRR